MAIELTAPDGRIWIITPIEISASHKIWRGKALGQQGIVRRHHEYRYQFTVWRNYLPCSGRRIEATGEKLTLREAVNEMMGQGCAIVPPSQWKEALATCRNKQRQIWQRIAPNNQSEKTE